MKRAKHSLSHYKLFTADMGQLIPIAAVPVLPGDTFRHRTSVLVRVSPPVAPVMHPIQVRIHHWYVPNRILWEQWEDFITGDNVQVNPPLATVGATGKGTLHDYFGVPPVEGLQYDAFPVYAYNKIFNEAYRDQDLVDEVTLGSGGVKRIAWEKEYFTSSRPWAQKGEDVTIPVGSTAPVMQDIAQRAFRAGFSDNNDYDFTGESNGQANVTANTQSEDYETGLYVDLVNSAAVNAREFRAAMALQRYQEARARYGSRYSEYLAYLGVKSSDARLQRPEYLGGGKQTISFSEVLQTVDDETGAERGPLGKLGGHGIAAVRSNAYQKFFEEHGYVITLMSARPKAMYHQGVPKKFLHKTKEDYWQRELQHIGAQQVLNKEVYAQNSPEDEEVFGYQDRYREYREEHSSVSADFRDTFNYWHMSREFGALPALNQQFVECNPTKRIHADQENNTLWCMAHHSIQARRQVAKRASVGRLL